MLLVALISRVDAREKPEEHETFLENKTFDFSVSIFCPDIAKITQNSINSTARCGFEQRGGDHPQIRGERYKDLYRRL